MPQGRPSWLPGLLPMARWWPVVDADSLRADLVAGFTGAIILVPQAIAYARIAGLPAEYGLYTAIVPVIVAALFGSSLHLVSGPTAAISIVVYATLSPLAAPGSAAYVNLALTLTFMVGAATLALALARAGRLVDFISHTVVIGFTAGAALLIAAGQLKHFFGVPIADGASFYGALAGLAGQIGRIDPAVTSVGVVTLATGLAVRRFAPQVPHMVAALLAGSVYAWALDRWLGEASGIATVAAIPASLPPLSLPDLSFHTVGQLLPIALAVTLLSLTEAIAIARAIAAKSGQRIDSNQEFFGQGLANLLGSFFSAYVSTGSFTRSGVNYAAGARTPLASVFSAGFLVLTLLMLAPLIRYLPIASMAAVLLIVAYSLVDFRYIKVVLRASRAESAVLFTTLAATLFVQLEFAIYAGVILSLVLFLERTARPAFRDALPAPGQGSYHFVPREGRPECCQLKMAFVDGALYFGAVDHVQRSLRRVDAEDPAHKHLLILAPGMTFVDLSGAELLAQEARRRRQIGGGLYFHRLQEPVVQTLQRAGCLQDIGTHNLFAIGQDVVAELYPRLDSDVCRRCTNRIFRQCHQLLPNGEPRQATP